MDLAVYEINAIVAFVLRNEFFDFQVFVLNCFWLNRSALKWTVKPPEPQNGSRTFSTLTG